MREADDQFGASLTIHYELIKSIENTAIIDSASFSYQIVQGDTNGLKLYQIPFLMPFQEEYLLTVTIRDNQKKFEEDYYIKIDNKSSQSRQSFYVQLKNYTTPLFRNYLSDRDSVKISYRDSTVKKLSVSYYHRNFMLAPPPYGFDVHDEFDYTPDSTFDYFISGNNYIALSREGFYHFRIDTSDKEGLTLFRFHYSFPSVTRPEQMIESMRYLTTKKEFEEMMQSPAKKAAIEKLWLDFSGDADRARLLIKKYYTRVQEANKFFSSYTEGWRTDRGMLYIIFGKPTNVYKTAASESWTYGQPSNALSLNFLFTRVNNPFSDNDMTLGRSPIYESFWYRAVDVWRQGRAYNDY
jgi:GWxTD domain-containing protein